MLVRLDYFPQKSSNTPCANRSRQTTALNKHYCQKKKTPPAANTDTKQANKSVKEFIEWKTNAYLNFLREKMEH